MSFSHELYMSFISFIAGDMMPLASYPANSRPLWTRREIRAVLLRYARNPLNL